MSIIPKHIFDSSNNNVLQYISRVVLKDKHFNDSNVFNKYFFLKNKLDIQLCENIIKSYDDNVIENNLYDKINDTFPALDIDNFTNFEDILTHMQLCIDEISNLYHLQDLNIQFLRIRKLTSSNNILTHINKNNSFLSFCILLNKKTEFTGGSIHFLYNNDIIILEQGIPIVHSRFLFTYDNLMCGNMYLLFGNITINYK
jgi:hypothetical protein